MADWHILRPKPPFDASIHRETSVGFVPFHQIAIPSHGFLWDATRHAGHTAVRVGLPGDIFPRASAPYKGHPHHARIFAEQLAQAKL